MRAKQKSYFGYIGAGFFGAAIAMSIGAAQPNRTVYPRYNATNHGPFLHITDNDTNKQYIYQNKNDASKLLGYVDLNQTGKPELKAVKAEGN